MEQRMPYALRPLPTYCRISNEHVGQFDVVGTSPAHTQDLPGIQQSYALGIHWHREVQHRRPGLGILVNRAGHQQIARGRTTGKDLAPIDKKSTIDSRRRA